MSQPELNPDAVDNSKQRRRGKTKGRVVDLNALLEVQNLLGDESRARDLLIEHLHRIQDHYGHLSAAHLVALAHEMRLATTEVYEVASFYHHFDVVREGDNAPPALTVRVCDSVSCEMAGSEDLIAPWRRRSATVCAYSACPVSVAVTRRRSRWSGRTRLIVRHAGTGPGRGRCRQHHAIHACRQYRFRCLPGRRWVPALR